jgi:hypothetical protein
MKIEICEKEGAKVALVEGEEIIIVTAQDALDLMADPALEGARRIILKRENIAPEFFDLSTRIAGEILQKFVTYQMKLAIVGDFSDLSQTFADFAYESNRGSQIFFCATVDDAKTRLFSAK